MDLFTPVIKESEFHPNFRNILIRESATIKDTFQEWAKDFPDRDNKIVKQFQETFNSTFWEIYLHKLFKEYKFNFNWDYSSPDFYLEKDGLEFIVEAVTSNHSNKSTPEWIKNIDIKTLDSYVSNKHKLNTYSMIRHSSAIYDKHKKLKDYKEKDHVKNKPFILALGAYEMPFFYYQYDRPIMALLYNHYINEQAYEDNPVDYPFGPPVQELNYVTKDNATKGKVELGIFLDDRYADISAILFNHSATFGKLKNMTLNPSTIVHNWLTNENKRFPSIGYRENIEDGLFVFHNPFATNPLPLEVFEKDNIRQVTYDLDKKELVHYFEKPHLIDRVNIMPQIIKKFLD